MTKRIQSVNSLIKKEIAKLLAKEVDFPQDILVTVSRVDCSANLIEAKVYIAALPEDKWPEAEKVLAENIWFLQKKLDKILRMRPVPKIIFLKEKKLSEAAKIEELLEEIKKENQ